MTRYRFSVDMNEALADELTALSEASGQSLGQVFCDGIALLSASLDALGEGMSVGAWRKDAEGAVVQQVEYRLQEG